jgi:hypothetical protein
VAKASEVKAFRRHVEPVIAVLFLEAGQKTLSASRDGAVLPWALDQLLTAAVSGDPYPSTNPGTVVRPVVPPAGELRASGRLEVGGTVTNLLLSPNGKWLFYLNVTAGKLARIEVATLRRDRIVNVPTGTEVVRLSPDGKTLAALTTKRPGQLLVLDPTTLEVRSEIPLETPGYDLALSDTRAYVSGNDDGWSDVRVLDLTTGKVLNRHSGVWTQSLLGLTSDGKRLYHSSQGVQPGTLEALYLGDRPEQSAGTGKALQPGRQPLGGEFFLSPDGQLLLFRSGTVLRLAGEREQDMRFQTALEPFLHAAFDTGRKLVFILSREQTLDVYGYPDMKLRASKRLDLLATQLAVSPATGKILVGGIDPRTLGDRPRGKGVGDVFTFDLADVVGK